MFERLCSGALFGTAHGRWELLSGCSAYEFAPTRAFVNDTPFGVLLAGVYIFRIHVMYIYYLFNDGSGEFC
jgi:hypothetical protein